jgi:pimeloyl-ACP methyl ester carboxylesterase
MSDTSMNLATQPFEALALSRTVLDNGLVFHHVEQGDGPSLVFLHGVLGDWRTWAPQWDAFTAHFHCISYSRRYSVPNHNRQPSPDHSALQEADDLEALMSRWETGPSVLVGASYGAYTALALALRKPEMVQALVLVEPPLMWLAAHNREALHVRNEFEQHIRLPARKAFEQGDDTHAVWLLTEGILGAANFTAQSRAAMARRMENLESLKRLTLSSNEFPELDLARLSALQIPTLLLSGENTPPIHDLVFQQVRRALPEAESHKVQSAGHGVARDQPQAFNALALDFLARRITP